MTPTSYLWNHKANWHQFLFATFSVNLAKGIKSAAIPIIEHKTDVPGTETNSTYCWDRYKMGKKIVRLRSECDGTRWRTGGEVKGKLANGVGSSTLATSERGLSSITQADAHTSAVSSRLNWRPRRFKWTRPFRRKTKSGFCACAPQVPHELYNLNNYGFRRSFPPGCRRFDYKNDL